MTTDELRKTYKRMLWIIPGMILAMVGDYCMGIEPAACYTVAALPFAAFLRSELPEM